MVQVGTAFLAHFLRAGDAVKAARDGNRLGAYVASMSGAIPATASKFAPP